MEDRFPPLRVGETYTAEEVRPHVAEDDIKLVLNGFPKDLDYWPDVDILAFRPSGLIVFEFTIWDVELIRLQIEELRILYAGQSDHLERVNRIANLLMAGTRVFPIFVQFNDPRRRILEGMHRAVAMLDVGALRLPVLRAKYPDWR